MKRKSKIRHRVARHKRVRAKIKGTADRPRLSVFRSNQHIWTQLIDDTDGKTLVAVNDLNLKIGTKKSKIKAKSENKEVGGFKINIAEKVGELVAEKALKKKIFQVVFDRGGYKYHGVIKAVADGARKGGLKF